MCCGVGDEVEEVAAVFAKRTEDAFSPHCQRMHGDQCIVEDFRGARSKPWKTHVDFELHHCFHCADDEVREVGVRKRP